MKQIQRWVPFEWVPNHPVRVIFRAPHDLRAWIVIRAPGATCKQPHLASLEHFPIYIHIYKYISTHNDGEGMACGTHLGPTWSIQACKTPNPLECHQVHEFDTNPNELERWIEIVQKWCLIKQLNLKAKILKGLWESNGLGILHPVKSLLDLSSPYLPKIIEAPNESPHGEPWGKIRRRWWWCSYIGMKNSFFSYIR